MAKSTPIPLVDMVAERAWGTLGAKLALEIGIALREYQREIDMQSSSRDDWFFVGIAVND